MTAAGLTVGALIVTSMVPGSSVLSLLASLIAILASMVSPLIGMVALAFVAPLARPTVIPPPGLYVAMVVAMLFGVILRLPVDRPRLRFPSAEVLLLGGFLLYAAVHLLGGRIDGYSGARSTEIASLFARLTEGVVSFGVAYVVLRGRSPYPVLASLLASAALASVLGVSQQLGADGMFGGLLDPLGASGRISGPFANPNYFGAYLASMVVLAVALAAEASSTRVRAVLIALTALLSAGLLLTQSRGGLVTVMAGLIAIAFIRSRRIGVGSLAVLALIVAIAYPSFSEWRFGTDDVDPSAGLSTAAGRTEAWSAGGESFVSSPLFGIGLGRFEEESPGGIAAHNWYVQVLAELGIVGFVIWSLFIAATAIALRGRTRPARSVGYSILVVWMVASLTMSPPASYGITGPVLLAIAAASVALWSPGRRALDAATLRTPLDEGQPPGHASPSNRLAEGRRRSG